MPLCVLKPKPSPRCLIIDRDQRPKRPVGRPHKPAPNPKALKLVDYSSSGEQEEEPESKVTGKEKKSLCVMCGRGRRRPATIALAIPHHVKSLLYHVITQYLLKTGQEANGYCTATMTVTRQGQMEVEYCKTIWSPITDKDRKDIAWNIF